MSKKVLAALLHQGVRRWNKARPDVRVRLDLTGLNLVGCELEGANLNNVDLSGTDLSSARLNRADLRLASLNGARLRNTQMRQVDLDGASLMGARCEYTDLRGTCLGGAIFDAAVLVGLRQADLVNAVKSVDRWNDLLTHYPGFRPVLAGADLSNTSLDFVNLFFADLCGACFVDAGLGHANLRRANLEGACFDGASLDYADLTKCRLQGASFRHVDLSTIKLDNERVRRALVLQVACEPEQSFLTAFRPGKRPAGFRRDAPKARDGADSEETPGFSAN